MKWTHLPNAGGLYDQDPELLDKFQIIFSEIGEHERREREKEEAERKRNESKNNRSSRTPMRGGGRRRR